jgi:hypothetical protein
MRVIVVFHYIDNRKSVRKNIGLTVNINVI